jgi:hypothetical protein
LTTVFSTSQQPLPQDACEVEAHRWTAGHKDELAYQAMPVKREKRAQDWYSSTDRLKKTKVEVDLPLDMSLPEMLDEMLEHAKTPLLVYTQQGEGCDAMVVSATYQEPYDTVHVNEYDAQLKDAISTALAGGPTAGFDLEDFCGIFGVEASYHAGSMIVCCRVCPPSTASVEETELVVNAVIRCIVSQSYPVHRGSKPTRLRVCAVLYDFPYIEDEEDRDDAPSSLESFRSNLQTYVGRCTFSNLGPLRSLLMLFVLAFVTMPIGGVSAALLVLLVAGALLWWQYSTVVPERDDRAADDEEVPLTWNEEREERNDADLDEHGGRRGSIVAELPQGSRVLKSGNSFSSSFSTVRMSSRGPSRMGSSHDAASSSTAPSALESAEGSSMSLLPRIPSDSPGEGVLASLRSTESIEAAVGAAVERRATLSSSVGMFGTDVPVDSESSDDDAPRRTGAI